MLNASFCGVDYIPGSQAVELQDRNMVLHGNPVTEITWAFENQLTKIPTWLRTLEYVTLAELQFCDVKEIKGGAFPVSLEWLGIGNQIDGLRLHPDSFEGLSKLRRVAAMSNNLNEDDMHPGLFGDAKLEELHIAYNQILNFDAAALFPGSSGQQLESLTIQSCGLTEIGGGSATNFHGLLVLKELDLAINDFGNRIAEDAFHGLTELKRVEIYDARLTSLPAQVFAGECRSSGWGQLRF